MHRYDWVGGAKAKYELWCVLGDAHKAKRPSIIFAADRFVGVLFFAMQDRIRPKIFGTFTKLSL